jgi:hypothetical protein
VTRTLIGLLERSVSAIERIASALERREPAARPRSFRRGLRAPKKPPSEVIVPTELDRARAAKALKRLGY